jgi:hypothetical protein
MRAADVDPDDCPRLSRHCLILTLSLPQGIWLLIVRSHRDESAEASTELPHNTVKMTYSGLPTACRLQFQIEGDAASQGNRSDFYISECI